ncbi:MAG: funZ protein [Fibrobacterota bacterium]|nr:MAG: funZ protein [Fibrobacterota bacterium]
MRKIKDLNFGFADAVNYKLKENKSLFNKIFVRNDFLEKILQPSKYFLVGEKGTGKTAYSVFLSNGEYKNTTASLKYLGDSEYVRFYNLVKSKQIQYTDFKSIWSVILLLIILEQLKDASIKTTIIQKLRHRDAIIAAINEFYANAFSPEIATAMTIVEEAQSAAAIAAKFINLTGSEKVTTQFSETRIQLSLLYLEKQFKECLSCVKIKTDHILFIDGIDIRPPEIGYPEYIQCIKGLAEAAWQLNMDFFSTIKSEKRIKVVLLLRPDIFQSLGLHNATNKLRDNSVYLDWRTTYPEYRRSKLFGVADLLLNAQQTPPKDIVGECWDTYFPFKTPASNANRSEDDAFIAMLRTSYFRPRDIVTQLEILQKLQVITDTDESFTPKQIECQEYLNELSEYYVGTIRDQLLFYYSEKEWESFRLFFSHIEGYYEFDYSKYETAFTNFKNDPRVGNSLPVFASSKDEFLQFLYDLNILCHFERSDNRDQFYHWCYRERDASNLSPKVALKRRYMIHYGLRKSLNLYKKQND